MSAEVDDQEGTKTFVWHVTWAYPNWWSMFDFTTGTNETQFYRNWDFALPLKFHRKHPCLTVKDKGFPVQKHDRSKSGAELVQLVVDKKDGLIELLETKVLTYPYIPSIIFHLQICGSFWVKHHCFKCWLYIYIYLVGGLEHVFFDFPYIGNFIIPTDEVIFFRGVGQPPTRYSGSSPKGWCSSYREVRPLDKHLQEKPGI